MNKDPFSTVAARRDSSLNGMKRTFAEYTGGILLTVCLLFTAALPLVVLRLVNPFSAEFFVNTAYTGLTSYLAYLIFLPEGKRAEEGRGVYPAVTERLAAFSAYLREHGLSAFVDYCKTVAERECEQRRRAYLLRYTCEGALCSERSLRRARRRAARMRVRPIHPSLILCGEGAPSLSSVGRRRLSYGARSALMRPPLVLGMAILLSSVSILPAAAGGIEVLVRILSGLFSVTTAAFAGYAAGCGEVRYRIGVAESKILFLCGFCEETGLSLPPNVTE